MPQNVLRVIRLISRESFVAPGNHDKAVLVTPECSMSMFNHNNGCPSYYGTSQPQACGCPNYSGMFSGCANYYTVAIKHL